MDRRDCGKERKNLDDGNRDLNISKDKIIYMVYHRPVRSYFLYILEEKNSLTGELTDTKPLW